MSFPAEVSTHSTNNNSVAHSEKKIDNCKGKMFKLTINNYDENVCLKLKEFCYCSSYSPNLTYSIGFEVGDETKTPHIQGYLRFQNEIRRSTIKNALDREFYIELVKKNKNQTIQTVDEQNDDYCQKEETHEGRRWIFPIPPPAIKIISKLRPFQKSLEDILTGPVDDGKILWVYDEKGQIGKTDFLRYMHVTHGIPFAYGGKCGDVMNLVFNAKHYYLGTDKGAMIFNFGRETDMNKVSYKAFEQISDGAIYNSKFEAGCFVCNKPHVLVLANDLPNVKKMTQSRWKIFTVDDDFQLVNYVEPTNPLDD